MTYQWEQGTDQEGAICWYNRFTGERVYDLDQRPRMTQDEIDKLIMEASDNPMSPYPMAIPTPCRCRDKKCSKRNQTGKCQGDNKQ